MLDMTQTVPDISSTSTATSATLALPTQTSGSSNNPFSSIAYSPTEKMMITHGVLSALGFCFFLPIGVLQARFLRIWWPRWFRTHWVVQAGLAGPFIVAGFALGVSAVSKSGVPHFSDRHMIIGLVLLLVYICQALYGLVIHLVKSPNRKRRPIQNYGHAIVGLSLISLALYQVWRGFDYEWSMATGRGKAQRGVHIFWVVWMTVLGAAYIIGLVLLPKQYKAEAGSQNGGMGDGKGGSSDNIYPMTNSNRRE